ncbi:MAG: hypothetical protein HYY40_14620 [Bacteroidetes bacterium]|nr:hypothetical protein [Bacteroidota bacterium]
MEGYADTYPNLSTIKINSTNIELHFADGRILIAPIDMFPAIKNLKPEQRVKYNIIAGIGFDFDDSDEVYHISDFLGRNNSIEKIDSKIKLNSKSQILNVVAEPVKQYGKKKP